MLNMDRLGPDTAVTKTGKRVFSFDACPRSIFYDGHAYRHEKWALTEGTN